jgi:hypothetical protein
MALSADLTPSTGLVKDVDYARLLTRFGLSEEELKEEVEEMATALLLGNTREDFIRSFFTL